MAWRKSHRQEGDNALCSAIDSKMERHKREELDVCEVHHDNYVRKNGSKRNIFPNIEARWEVLGGEP